MDGTISCFIVINEKISEEINERKYTEKSLIFFNYRTNCKATVFISTAYFSSVNVIVLSKLNTVSKTSHFLKDLVKD